MSDFDAPSSPDPSLDGESRHEGPDSPDLSAGETTDFDSSMVNISMYNTPSAASPIRRNTGKTKTFF